MPIVINYTPHVANMLTQFGTGVVSGFAQAQQRIRDEQRQAEQAQVEHQRAIELARVRGDESVRRAEVAGDFGLQRQGLANEGRLQNTGLANQGRVEVEGLRQGGANTRLGQTLTSREGIAEASRAAAMQRAEFDAKSDMERAAFIQGQIGKRTSDTLAAAEERARIAAAGKKEPTPSAAAQKATGAATVGAPDAFWNILRPDLKGATGTEKARAGADSALAAQALMQYVNNPNVSVREANERLARLFRVANPKDKQGIAILNQAFEVLKRRQQTEGATVVAPPAAQPQAQPQQTDPEQVKAQIRAVKDQLTQQLGRTPTRDELKAALQQR